jgi:ribosome-associated protein
MDPIAVTDTVSIPDRALTWRAVRSGGPGGQNVNKVASKVELRIVLDALEGLAPDALERLRHLVRNRLDAEGRWLIVSDLTRDQLKNLEDARAKAAAVVRQALVRPKVRHATRPTRGSQERRLESKKRTAELKRGRRGED